MCTRFLLPVLACLITYSLCAACDNQALSIIFFHVRLSLFLHGHCHLYRIEWWNYGRENIDFLMVITGTPP